ncbi:gamma-adaptin 1 [Arabidopsis thaliana]|uniref:AP-1 complex subunit gamma-1 n=2 Tax=Arabidopsis thaliana TaxID=3702 RepID=AP1G1_ARATH|nr:gamma-adaptin 1 [Arabidopsis thaliana]NP_849701.1 gamma-adaptin 1 [Arabidopsis thaliana]Q84K16.1 RecName: Full=AP-1 complex subunit gamma-1; AltName: Full=Adaptor protein complex AP-1 large subunit gamma-1; AltName: Full=Adaptor-related protein complex 1 subunit gamma-1; AltName: Full=Clathrin assembly protein complex 1 gamma-1 large chain; Short=At-g-Ad; Short=At-gamma-Ad; AltName: Full=Gamma-adaptin 1 [Arabidopsis thaliana]AAO42305.1 putative gamma-adaptin [Arabidopsis thaliana]AAO63977.1 |eukprot:NP_173802.1 gamma-adaptin 1 [Arabidopsis thaliana]
MNPFSSGTRLRDMIRAIRACKTAAEERAVVRKECADIRALINEDDPHDRHRNLAKLMFIHMLGYPTHFGQMECLKLIASPGFPEKRIGYLGLMLLLDERQEVLMLVTNSLKQDLNHSNQYVVGLALCALGNICSAEMARDLAPEVERLIQFRDPNIRKKAALCSTRIIRKVPDLAENFVNAAASLLKEKHHGVLITGVQLCYELCTINDEALEYFRTKCTEGLIKTLRDITNSAYQPEYDVAGITDPFLHIRLLRLLRVLGQGDADASDLMTDILAQVATKTESNKNAGNAVLYECVETIMAIEDTNSLRVLAINILGRFLSNRDNNIRYVALNMLMKAITFDDQAVQRHRVTILECVKDPDASIRKRALELVTLLVNENNVTQLTKELIDYLEISDEDFKEDLSAKICFIVEKFSPEKLWYIDQMLKVLCEAGKFVKDDVWHALIVVISNASELHGYTVRALYKSVLTYSEQETLVRVAVWCIGEYGDLLVNNVGMLGIEDPITVTESDAVDVIEDAITRHNSDSTTKAMALVALLKLSSRFPSISERIKDIIVKQKGSLLLEMQQRAIEYNSIVDRHKNIRSSLVDRMPVLDEATFNVRRAGSFPASVSTMAKPSVSLQNGVEKLPVAPLVDLLDLDSDDIMAAPSPSGTDFLQDLLGVDLGSSSAQYGATQAPKAGTDLLLDILSIGTPSPAQNSTSSIGLLSIADVNNNPSIALDTLSSPAPPHVATTSSTGMFDLLDGLSPSPSKEATNGPAYAPIVAYESSSLKIEFTFSKTPGNLQTTNVQATFTNLSPNTFTDFIFQAAVPKFLQLHLDPASSNTLLASGSGAITQNLRVTNSQQGKKSLVMRMRIGYKLNGKDVLEEGQVSNFPRGL